MISLTCVNLGCHAMAGMYALGTRNLWAWLCVPKKHVCLKDLGALALNAPSPSVRAPPKSGPKAREKETTRYCMRHIADAQPQDVEKLPPGKGKALPRASASPNHAPMQQ